MNEEYLAVIISIEDAIAAISAIVPSLTTDHQRKEAWYRIGVFGIALSSLSTEAGNGTPYDPALLPSLVPGWLLDPTAGI